MSSPARADLFRIAAIVDALLLLAAAALAVFHAPADTVQGVVQKIFYLHVPSAIAAYAAFAVVFARRTTRPIRDLATAAGRVARDDLSVQVRPSGPNELRDLPYAEADVEGLARALRAAGYPGENVVVQGTEGLQTAYAVIR